jgi:hypothetical protein
MESLLLLAVRPNPRVGTVLPWPPALYKKPWRRPLVKIDERHLAALGPRSNRFAAVQR